MRNATRHVARDISASVRPAVRRVLPFEADGQGAASTYRISRKPEVISAELPSEHPQSGRVLRGSLESIAGCGTCAGVARWLRGPRESGDYGPRSNGAS